MKSRLNTILAIIAKSAKLAKILKSAKMLKVFMSLGSAVIFGATYSMAMGIALAAMFTLLLFIHEAGHCIALARHGYGLKAPIFIPFLGAAIMAPPFESREKEASVGIGGPLIGSLAAMLCLFPYFYTHNHFWLAAAQIGIVINLFNLIPISPLDGGRITQAVDTRLKWIGIGLLLWATVAIGEPGMLLIWVIVISDFNWSFRQMLIPMTAIVALMWILPMVGVGRVFWANIVDAILATVLVSMCWLAAAYGRRGMAANAKPDDERQACPARVRWGYLSAYLALGAILYATSHYITAAHI